MSGTTQTKYRDVLESFSTGFPLLPKVYEVYEQTQAISEDQENTLRRSVEMNLLEIIELVVVAHRQSKEAKVETLRQATIKVDTVKVFVDMADKTKMIDKKQADLLRATIDNVGKMVGGMRKQLSIQKESN